MSAEATQNRWFSKIVDQLRAAPGAESEVLKDGRIAITITFNGESRKLIVVASASDYRAQKDQCRRIRETLAELGIETGMRFTPRKRSGRAVSPEMLAARAKQKKEFEAWKEVCRTISKAEESLDVEFEIAQMQDYY